MHSYWEWSNCIINLIQTVPQPHSSGHTVDRLFALELACEPLGYYNLSSISKMDWQQHLFNQTLGTSIQISLSCHISTPPACHSPAPALRLCRAQSAGGPLINTDWSLICFPVQF